MDRDRLIKINIGKRHLDMILVTGPFQFLQQDRQRIRALNLFDGYAIRVVNFKRSQTIVDGNFLIIVRVFLCGKPRKIVRHVNHL